MVWGMEAWQALLSGLLSVLSAISLCSNLLVLLCFARSAEIRRPAPGVFILNLSLCNLLTGALTMPGTLLGVVRGGRPVGEVACRGLAFLETFLSCNSMLSVAALGVDRWVAVVFPLSYARKLRRRDAALMVAYAWLQSLCFSLAAMLRPWAHYSHAYASCTLRARQGETGDGAYAAFTVAFHACSFALSLITLCCAYLKVLRVARSHCRRIDVITVQTLLLLVDIHPSVKQRCLSEQKRRKRRATRKITIFIGSFVICFAPYVTTRLAELLPLVQVSPHWGILTRCLVYCKAASDPFIYSLLRQQYKKVLLQLLNRLLRRDKFPSSGHSSSMDTENDYCLQRIS